MNLTLIRNSLIALSVVILLVLWAVMISQYNDYDKASDGFEQKKADLNVKKIEIETLKKALEKFKAEKEEFSKLLFNERDVPAFLDQISQYAKEAEIKIVDMKTQQFYEVQVNKEVAQEARVERRLANQIEAQKKSDALRSAQTLSAMPIQIRVKGSYASFVGFLDHLQEYKQLINIANVEIKAGNEYPVLDCEFVIRIYTLKTTQELIRK